MSYELRFSKIARRQFKKMDRHQAALLTRWLFTNIDGIDDPRKLGKGLVANRSGEWRYRVGKYRIILEIRDSELIVETIQIGHSKNIYD
ncbi:type II toxin-antitoxin system RelE family toxin [Candidatus Enterococcus murrayae]|uniref:Type II toxin-antitoxin system RelE/ParE family toxin n=1 Tax=Candidatus Enterococcus murrayae TaxID=2815321 RepID=A0ABS3HNM3_9ENTE|nr:type II toxin-antitoxin system RelE/ParE family toxin [Enterococcus sp. MJM16]MBO0454607.1 type II toxin-antitoxin system RelE/ParE family toxin [Enterococcus sp. MJM16]